MTGSGVIAITIGNYLSNPIPAFAGWFCLHLLLHPSGFPGGREVDAKRMRTTQEICDLASLHYAPP